MQGQGGEPLCVVTARKPDSGSPETQSTKRPLRCADGISSKSRSPGPPDTGFRTCVAFFRDCESAPLESRLDVQLE
jgi:hypothetical protein